MARIIISLPTGDVTHELTGDVVTVGRTPDNKIQINHRSVSAHHARLILTNGNYRLKDLDSTNHSCVNSIPVTEAVLTDSCFLRFGTIECVYKSEKPTISEELASQLREVQNQLENLMKARDLSHQQNQALLKERDEVKRAAETAQENLTKANKQLEEIIGKRNAAQKQLDEISAKLAATQKEIESKNRENDLLLESNKKIQKERDEARGAAEAAQENLTKANKQLEEITGNRNAAQKQLDEISAKLAATQKEIESMRREGDLLLESNKKIQKERDEARGAAETAQENLTKANEQLEEITGNRNAAQKQLDEISAKLAAAQKEIAMVSRERNALFESNKELREERDEARGAAETAQENLAEMKKRFEETSGGQGSFQKQQDDASEKLAATQKEIAMVSRERNALFESNKELQSNLEKMAAQLNEARQPEVESPAISEPQKERARSGGEGGDPPVEGELGEPAQVEEEKELAGVGQTATAGSYIGRIITGSPLVSSWLGRARKRKNSNEQTDQPANITPLNLRSENQGSVFVAPVAPITPSAQKHETVRLLIPHPPVGNGGAIEEIEESKDTMKGQTMRIMPLPGAVPKKQQERTPLGPSPASANSTAPSVLGTLRLVPPPGSTQGASVARPLAAANTAPKNPEIRPAWDLLNTMRRSLHYFLRHQEELKTLQEMAQNARSLAGMVQAGLLRPTYELAFALDALIRDLYEQPKNIAPSMLRTIGQSIDFLATLFDETNLARIHDVSTAKILVVDDDPGIPDIIASTMGMVHVTTTSAAQPSTALAHLSEQDYNLILLDISLPLMNGMDLCSRVRALPQYQKIPIVFLTGYATAQNRATCTLNGGNDMIGKPFNVLELSVKVLTWIFKGQLGLI